MEKWTPFVVGILLALLFISSCSTIGLMNIRSGLESDLKSAEVDAKEWKIESNRWMEKYLNYNCPEPEHIIEYVYETETEYVYETIETTIYINNAIFDVNRDGVVNYLDAAEVLWYIQHGRSMVEKFVFSKYGNPYESLYDVNADGVVDMKDVELIWQNRDYC